MAVPNYKRDEARSHSYRVCRHSLWDVNGNLINRYAVHHAYWKDDNTLAGVSVECVHLDLFDNLEDIRECMKLIDSAMKLPILEYADATKGIVREVTPDSPISETNPMHD